MMIMVERHRKELWAQPGLSSVFYPKKQENFPSVQWSEHADCCEKRFLSNNEEVLKHYKKVGCRQVLVASKAANPGPIKSHCQ